MMSDGALSQDEIDALLAGVDSSAVSGLGGGAPAATMTAPPLAGANFDRSVLGQFFSSTTNARRSGLIQNPHHRSEWPDNNPSTIALSNCNFLFRMVHKIMAVSFDIFHTYTRRTTLRFTYTLMTLPVILT